MRACVRACVLRACVRACVKEREREREREREMYVLLLELIVIIVVFSFHLERFSLMLIPEPRLGSNPPRDITFSQRNRKTKSGERKVVSMGTAHEVHHAPNN